MPIDDPLDRQRRVALPLECPERMQGRTERGALLLLEQRDGKVRHVRDDLPPRSAVRAAAGQHDLAGGKTEPFELVETEPERERRAFDGRAQQMPFARVMRPGTDEARARARQVGRTLAVEE